VSLLENCVDFLFFWVWVVFCLLFGCGVGGFGFTYMLVLLVVGVGYVGVSWLWGRNKFGVYHLSLRLRNLNSEALKLKIVFKRVSLCISNKKREKTLARYF
jgi:hypothetical protein